MALTTTHKCGSCGFDVVVTATCHCCSKLVCETCMPELDVCCIECQTVFPVALQTLPLAPLTLVSTLQTQVPFVANCEGSSYEHSSEAPKANPSRPEFVCDTQSRHTRTLAGNVHETKSQNGASQQNAIASRHVTPLLVDVLKKSLQSLEMEQSQRDYVIHNFQNGVADVMDIDKKISAITGQEFSSSADNKERAPTAKKENKSPRPVHRNGKRPAEGRTMMVCNIPCRVRHADLVEAIESIGFAQTYGFIHLPARREQRDSNLGYGFIHFFHGEDAERFALAFEGYRFPYKASTKACTVKVASCQGSMGNVGKHRTRLTKRESRITFYKRNAKVEN